MVLGLYGYFAECTAFADFLPTVFPLFPVYREKYYIMANIPFFSLIAMLLLSSACDKQELDTPAIDGRVEIFGLETFAWLDNGVCAVDPGSAVLTSTPLVTNEGIVSYDLSSYILEFQGESARNIKDLAPRAPFAVTVNGEIIFIGVCMQSIMSSVCFESVTLENLIYGPNKAKLELGYPGTLAGSPVEDKRTDAALLGALQSQGKLRY